MFGAGEPIGKHWEEGRGNTSQKNVSRKRGSVTQRGENLGGFLKKRGGEKKNKKG